ncbi:adenosylcobinamide-GDP ribazoletransferase [Candidatus Marithrix sp. Canyon 246]|uniref:adenosylcobinamide-GDP ribazoletransferase n=1 Tax=Candidatus Marithrix sp. Canyon 246 TaxID=1827136 RepID=UPI00084A2814|nr:adenosylcobinamide-GDP ribazoletransferase [Candidatus Marithrix sp. Canyon 246]
MLKTEIQHFVAALMFYTRIPCPNSIEPSNKSLKYFPLIGWIIGGIGVATLLIFHSILPLSVSILLSMAATIYATGAFHEDGFTDTCDAFGGGWTKPQILSIMKDSRIGAYGTVGIIVLLSLKWITLYEIGLYSVPILLISYLNAHISSRFMASLMVQSHQYVQDINKSKSSKAAIQLSLGEMWYSSIFVLLGGLFFYSYPLLLLAFPIAYMTKLYLGYYFNKRIGGYTGDCLGAIQQVTEIMFYLGILALCKFI